MKDITQQVLDMAGFSWIHAVFFSLNTLVSLSLLVSWFCGGLV